MSEEKQVVKAGHFDLSNMDHIGQFSESLQKFIKGNNLSMTIQKNEYVLVDGWKFAALNFGLSVIPSRPEKEGEGDVYMIQKDYNHGKPGKDSWWKTVYSTTYQDEFDEYSTKIGDKSGYRKLKKPFYRYKCDADVIRVSTSEKVSYGFAICTNAEAGKDGFDEYAVASMAQTRAIAKAIRNLLGFVMKAAGYADTPAEEINESIVTMNSDSELPILTDEIKARIASFTDRSELTQWATSDECALLQAVQEFKDAVNAKFNELKDAKNAK
jgi:hypothetical protein